MSERKAVLVRWIDHMKVSGDKALKDAQSLRPIERHTVGWLVHETDDYLVLGMDFSTDADGEHIEFGYVIHRALVTELLEVDA